MGRRTEKLLIGGTVAGLVLVLGLVGVASGQDTRKVVEPVYPVACAKLEAQLAKSGKTLPEDAEKVYDTERIQKAIDTCKPGMAVELTVGLQHKGIGFKPTESFLTGPLDLREGVTLLLDKGVVLFGSRDPKMYEVKAAEDAGADATPAEGRCGTSMPRPAEGTPRPKGGCRALINVDGVKNAAVMGEGAIDGRGYAKLIGHDYSWWEMARKAEPADDLYYSTKLIAASKADGFVLYKIRLLNAPNYHVTVSGTDGFTAWGVRIQTPADARNTDGIDPGTSKNITVAHSWIDNGDDNIAVKQGVTHMSVLDNHFYNGHGMSIGSETVLGVSFLVVDGLVEDHTTSGIRIKSNVKRGGPVHDLLYENVCMKDVKVPISISPYYTNQTTEPFEDPKYEGDKIPEYTNIILRNIYSETPGDVLIAGLDDGHRTQVTLEHVFIKGITPAQVHANYAYLKVAPHGTNIDLIGHDTVRQILKLDGPPPPDDKVEPCKGKFVPMDAGLLDQMLGGLKKKGK